MGGVTQALAHSAQAAGATILTGTPVDGIAVADGRAVGVSLADGRELPADAVLSNADPRRTLLGLVGAGELEAGFVEAVEHLDYSGSMARVHLALRELPHYEAAPHAGEEAAAVHSAFTLLGADLDRFARAHEAQRRGELPPDPVLEVTIPSTHDHSLSPPGMHTLTLGVMHVPRELARGDWDSRREELKALVAGGILQQRRDGTRTYFKAETRSPLFPELRGLIEKTAGLLPTLQQTLAPFRSRIDCAFVYGSVARTDEHALSDVDLMIIGDVGLADLAPALRKAEDQIGREINVTNYSVREFRKKAAAKDHFLTEVLRGSKEFVQGSQRDLDEIIGRQGRSASSDVEKRARRHAGAGRA